MAKITDIERWREELDLAEAFRDEEFGKITKDDKTKAGQNIDYFERGFSENLISSNSEIITTLNIVDSIVSIIVPTLYYKNPKTLVFPKKIESEDTSPIVARLIDHFRGTTDAESINQKVIWDAYVLGWGVYKIGYATKFGTDIPDEEKQKQRKSRSLVDRGLETLGLKKGEEEEVIRPEIDLRIVAESPFIEYISPFDFLIDPRATSINDAMWVCHTVRKTVKEMKANKKYKNTKDLKGSEPEVTTLDFNKITESEQEAFKTVDLHEIHYRNDDDMYMLVISREDDGTVTEHYHEKSIYDLGEWQFDILSFKSHGHTLYPRSDITKIQNLQDRITQTIDSILDQVDKFVPKLAYDGDSLDEQGENALREGGVGALVKTQGNPDGVFRELNFVQLKADLAALIEQFISLISIQTGITRAQLTGVSQSGTATEAQIEQGGQTIRLSDMTGKVQRLVNTQSRKFWRIIRQFVPLEELQLIDGVKGIDEETGALKYDWLLIDPERSDKLQEGDYDFDIETGSTQRMNLSVVRKSFENWFNILARTEVIELMQQQGKKVDVAELLKKGFDLFPELGIDSSKIVQNITQSTTGLVQPNQEQRGGTTAGSNQNALEAQQAAPAPTESQEIGQVF